MLDLIPQSMYAGCKKLGYKTGVPHDEASGKTLISQRVGSPLQIQVAEPFKRSLMSGNGRQT